MTAQEFQEFWQASGLTQKQLAEALGCSQSAISEWKDGKRIVPKKTQIIIRLMQENQALKQEMSNNAFAGDFDGAGKIRGVPASSVAAPSRA